MQMANQNITYNHPNYSYHPQPTNPIYQSNIPSTYVAPNSDIYLNPYQTQSSNHLAQQSQLSDASYQARNNEGVNPYLR